jgi:hypothetical protein
MDKGPYGWWETKKRRAWKKENPTFEFNGVTYRDHWAQQLSNSGKTTRWMGYLTGSDGPLPKRIEKGPVLLLADLTTNLGRQVHRRTS